MGDTSSGGLQGDRAGDQNRDQKQANDEHRDRPRVADCEKDPTRSNQRKRNQEQNELGARHGCMSLRFPPSRQPILVPSDSARRSFIRGPQAASPARLAR